jgi:hypothetical protein
MSNFHGPEHDGVSSNESTADAHARIALEHSAMVSAKLAIARWSNGSLGEHAPLSALDEVASRGRWLTQAQRQFQDWLEHGGFAQHEIDFHNTQSNDAARAPAPGNSTHDNFYVD